MLNRTLKPDHCNSQDRGHARFSLFNDIPDIRSSYVCRLRDNSQHEVLEDLPLTDADRAANVLPNQIVSIGQERRGRDRPNHPLRLVIVKVNPHASLAQCRGDSTGSTATAICGRPRTCWRFPRRSSPCCTSTAGRSRSSSACSMHLLGCRHLLSHNENGVCIQAYCAVIACLLIHVWTDRKPTRRTFEMLCLHMTGWAGATELERHLEKLKRRDDSAAKER